MDSDSRFGEGVRTAHETESAEAAFSRQAEDHTLPAMQVLGEQHESAAGGLASYGFIP
jgi:hypothetical protein